MNLKFIDFVLIFSFFLFISLFLCLSFYPRSLCLILYHINIFWYLSKKNSHLPKRWICILALKPKRTQNKSENERENIWKENGNNHNIHKTKWCAPFYNFILFLIIVSFRFFFFFRLVLVFVIFFTQWLEGGLTHPPMYSAHSSAMFKYQIVRNKRVKDTKIHKMIHPLLLPNRYQAN